MVVSVSLTSPNTLSRVICLIGKHTTPLYIVGPGAGCGIRVKVTENVEVLDGGELERIQGVMREVVRKASEREGTCVYRGEPECYRVVSSRLYRQCPNSENEAFDMGRVEQEMAENARQYTTLADADQILTEIQHFGGATNLIDFTDDYLVALFFASVEGDGKDGRVVLHWPESETMVTPKQTISRVVSQKSVFVRPRRGFIVPDARDETVVVPGDLKASILSFLERFHGISERTVYNDIHGFIRHQTLSRSRYAREFRGLRERTRCDVRGDLKRCLAEGELVDISVVRMRHAHHQRAMVYASDENSLFEVRSIPTTPHQPTLYHDFELSAEDAVFLFTHCIEENVGGMGLASVYCSRGEAHLYEGATDLAIRDFDEALARDAKMAEAYHGRGNAYRQQGSADRAMADWEEALRLKPNLPAALIDRGNAYQEGGALEEAIRDFDAAIAMTMGSHRRGLPGLGPGSFIEPWRGASRRTGWEPRATWRRHGKKGCWWHRRSGTSTVAFLSSKPGTTFGCLPSLRQCCTLPDRVVGSLEPASSGSTPPPSRGCSRGLRPTGRFRRTSTS